MNVIDPGHTYDLDHLDGSGVSRLVFVKREGVGYPGNVGSYEGTNMQEVLRAVIDRLKYLDCQIPDPRNGATIDDLRSAIRRLEERAADRHGRPFEFDEPIEYDPACEFCRHIGCDGSCRSVKFEAAVL